MENNINENSLGGHRIISPKKILNNDRKDIENLLQIISKKYKISIEDAAFALSKTLQSY